MKEFYTKIANVVNDYSTLLENKIKDDFIKNNEYPNILYLLLFNKMFNGKDIFEEIYFNNNYQGRTFDYIDEINFKNEEVSFKEDLFMFFDSINFNSYNDLNNYPGHYYICSKKFVKNIDKLLITNFKELGFTNSKQDVLVKKLSDNFKIEINCKVSRLRYGIENPADYLPPLISFEIHNMVCGIDIFKKLYNTISFINSDELFNFFFFRFENENKLKFKEPVAYFDEAMDKYILQNSPENLERFNKFILIFIELYKHYFKILDEWIVNDLYPKIEKSL